MKRLINWLFAIATAAAASMPCMADLQRGEVLHETGSICIDKADAIAIVDADVKDGMQAAVSLFTDLPKCNSINLTGAEVGRVVHHAEVKRGEAAKTMNVVELLWDGKVVAYLITSQVITARVEPIPRGGKT